MDSVIQVRKPRTEKQIKAFAIMQQKLQAKRELVKRQKEDDKQKKKQDKMNKKINKKLVPMQNNIEK